MKIFELFGSYVFWLGAAFIMASQEIAATVNAAINGGSIWSHALIAVALIAAMVAIRWAVTSVEGDAKKRSVPVED